MALVTAGLLAVTLAGCGKDKKAKSTATTKAPVTTAAPKGSAIVSIDMVDFSFQVSGPLIAGGTLKLSNKGSEFHMVAMGRFKAGKSLADVQAKLAEVAASPPGGATTTTAAARGATTTTARAASTTSTTRGATTTTGRVGSATTTTVAGNANGNPLADILDAVGLPGAVLSPGESADVTVPNLRVGSYALVCFMPGEGDGIPHFAKGMVGQLDVVAGDTPALPTADATYKLAPGKAVDGPTTLTAGRHTLKFEAAAGSNQLEPSLARLNPGTSFATLDAAVTKFFTSDTPQAKGAAAKLPGQVVFGGSNLDDVTAFFLTVDLKAGTYVIDAADTDTPPKGTPKELITIKVG